MSSSIFEYITLTQLMASVEDDMHKYADAGLVDAMKLIKVVRACNEKLGLRIYRSKHTLLYINHDGRADLPFDFYKAEMAFAITNRVVNTHLPIGPGLQQVTTPPTLCDVARGDITNLTGCCLDSLGDGCNWLIKTPLTQLQVAIQEFIPLHIGAGVKHFAGHSPNAHHSHRGSYEINVEEDFIETNFRGGVIYFSYLADMKNEDGEDIIPFSPLLNPYYEWSIKTKILQDIFINSEDDVFNKLKYAERERNLSFQDAVNFAMGKQAREWQKYDDARSREFFRKYYSIFH